MNRLNEGLEVRLPPRAPYQTRPFDLGRAGVSTQDKDAKLGGGIFKTKTTPFQGDPDIEQVVGANEFKNWGKNISFMAGYTLVVHSIKGVCKVVKWAKGEGRRVRVAGFRHSWSDVFAATGDVIVMFLPYDTLVELPYEDPPPTFKTELAGITPVASVAGRSAPSGNGYYKVMAGTTNETFRQWCFANKKFCLPLNVIMVEVTFGGTNAPICHGSGLSTTTLSDLVVEVEYVDANGVVQIVNDPTELLAASGAFGLLGVVVSITLKLDEMGVTNMMPVKVPMPLAIPPPKGYEIPYEVQKIIKDKGITDAQLKDAQKDFERRCEQDFYLEWFWFPYQDEIWVNTWSKRFVTDEDVNLSAYPGDGILNGVKSQQVQATLAETTVNYTPFRWLSGRAQAFILGLTSLLALPSITDQSQAIRTFQSEAQHFRRGIQNFRCWDTEWEIPIGKVQGKPNYDTIQRAWWDGITAIYNRKDAPVRVALEMRLTGGSNVILAPQRGNEVTASIEVLTTLITPKDDWLSFMQQIADKWTSYEVVKDSKGNIVYPRPHWAKQWAGLQVNKKPIEKYFKEDAYKGAFTQFKETYGKIIARTGNKVDDTLKVFGNDMMERLIFH